MEEDREQLESLMRSHGLTEKEAQAAYHLDRAWELFEEIYVGEPSDSQVEEETPQFQAAMMQKLATRLYGEVHFGAHFAALSRMLGMRVLERNYPEGWGQRPPSEE